MPRIQRVRSHSGYYHVMLRGNERKNIFLSDGDKLHFMEIMYEKKQGSRFYLHSFCLMDNHIHLMMSEGSEDVSKVMKRINVSYVSYFNKKHKRVGHLFQDRFKSEVVEQDSYVLSLARYIHQNPVKAGMVEKAGDYRWSSYSSYLGKDGHFAKIVDKSAILGLFSDDEDVAIKRFQEFMNAESTETFLDFDEIEVMEEEAALALFRQMRIQQESDVNQRITDDLIKDFRAKTKLSIRKIAEITGLNKDRVNKILKG